MTISSLQCMAFLKQSERIPKGPLKCFTNNKNELTWQYPLNEFPAKQVRVLFYELISHFTIGLYGPHRYVIM